MTRSDQNYICVIFPSHRSQANKYVGCSIFPKDVAVPYSSAVVAEWLRRLTRNQFPSGSAGSNPADCEYFWKI